MPFLDTPIVEPLPPYTPTTQSSTTSRVRDPETISIRSSAPSYVSEPPTYDAVITPNPITDAGVRTPRTINRRTPRRRHAQDVAIPQGLPRLHYAPGFVPRPDNPFSTNNYSNMSWSNVHHNPARKQYENVARRRMEQQTDVFDNLTLALTTSFEESEPSLPVAPANPHEDPDLVGPVAAERARTRREYLEMLRRDMTEAREVESHGWDFVLEQSVEARVASQLRLSEFPPKRQTGAAKWWKRMVA